MCVTWTIDLSFCVCMRNTLTKNGSSNCRCKSVQMEFTSPITTAACLKKVPVRNRSKYDPYYNELLTTELFSYGIYLAVVLIYRRF